MSTSISTPLDKISNFHLNSSRMKEAHYFAILFYYYMLKNINRRLEGGGHRSMSTPLNTPLSLRETPLVRAGNLNIRE